MSHILIVDDEEAVCWALKKALAGAKRPAHYLAIPPLLFGTVVEQLMNSGSAQNAPASGAGDSFAALRARIRAMPLGE